MSIDDLLHAVLELSLRPFKCILCGHVGLHASHYPTTRLFCDTCIELISADPSMAEQAVAQWRDRKLLRELEGRVQRQPRRWYKPQPRGAKA